MSIENDQKIIDYFLEKLTSEDSLSKNTVISYRHDILLFLEFLHNKGLKITNVLEDDIKSYLGFLHHEKAPKASTLMRKISVIKSLFNFLADENFIKSNPATNISNPKKEFILPKILDPQEILQLLKEANSDNSESGIRLSCIMEMLYSSGLRVSELVSLPISAVQNLEIINANDNFEQKTANNFLIINGKGNKERLVPLSISAIKRLKDYLLLRKELGQEDSKWLFPSNFRLSKKNKMNLRENILSFKDDHITRQRLHQMLKELAIKANVDSSKVYPHAIRHSFATHLLNNGIELRILQELLGHSDISTTQIYTHIMGSKLKDLVLRHHPLATKTINF